jgi:hypothetical protein
MFKWHGKDHSRFWHFWARLLPRPLKRWAIVVATANYMSVHTHVSPDSIDVMELVKFYD